MPRIEAESPKKVPLVESSQGTENKSEGTYNFPEVMAELKPAMLSVVEQLKEAIESGEYNTLISDDAAGRIPTLILRKIIQEKSPNGKDLKMIGLALGRGWRWDNKLDDYIKENREQWGKSLLVTEMTYDYRTMRSVYKYFDKNNGYTNYDIAVAFVTNSGEKLKALPPVKKSEYISNEIMFRERCIQGNEDADYPHKIIVGSTGRPKSFINNDILNELAGLQRRTFFALDADPMPMDVADELAIEGYQAEWIGKIERKPEPTRKKILQEQKRLGIDPYKENEYVRHFTDKLREKTPQKEVSKERIKEIQDTIRKARKDVMLMAKEIMEEVWKTKQ